MSGIFTLGDAVFFALGAPLARDGATRIPSPSIFWKCGGHGASPSPAASSRAASVEQRVERPGRRIHVGVRVA